MNMLEMSFPLGPDGAFFFSVEACDQDIEISRLNIVVWIDGVDYDVTESFVESELDNFKQKILDRFAYSNGKIERVSLIGQAAI